MSEHKTVDFFLGANTASGFRSYLNTYDEPQAEFKRFLIKGGPGTGKSGMMKKLSAALEKADSGWIEKIHCSSDADSLDGLIWEQGKAAVFDATPPHAVEPCFPGAYDRVIALTECFDNGRLAENLGQIRCLSEKIAMLHQRCRGLLAAAQMLSQQNSAQLSEYWQVGKLHRSVERFAKRLLYKQHGDGSADTVRMLSAVTDKGIITYEKTVSALADRILCIKDPYGVVADAYLDAIYRQAKKQGIKCTVCRGVLFPDRIEHLIMPEVRIAVVREDQLCRFSFDKMQIIHISRYLLQKPFKSLKSVLRHRNHMIADLLKDASGCLKQAKSLHDALEAYYTPAVDFGKVDRMTEAMIAAFMEK